MPEGRVVVGGASGALAMVRSLQELWKAGSSKLALTRSLQELLKMRIL